MPKKGTAMKETVPNCFYDKLRITHDLCRIVWFLRKHGINDAQKARDKECNLLFDKLAHDLEDYIDELRDMLGEDSCPNCSDE
jgi:hypothetical protein